MKVRIDYDPTPIRHIAVQCPCCDKWFDGRDITKDKLFYEYQIRFANFHCPVCGASFQATNDYLHIEEVMYPDVYKDCPQKKTTWK